MNRIPIIIQGAFLESSASMVSGGIEYTLTWNETTLSLELSNSANDEVQTIELTGIGGGSGVGLTEDQVREIAAQQIIEANRLTVPTASIAVYFVIFMMYFFVCWFLSLAARAVEKRQKK